MVEGWKYYNHAMVPITAPHEDVIMEPIENGDIWKCGGLFARWTSDFDCGYETNWWYIIKDSSFDISRLKSKRRYEINKGNRNFIVKEIIPTEWCEEIYNISMAAYETYSKAYKPNITYNSFISDDKNWNFYKVYGAFSIKDESLCGYACLIKKETYIDFCMMKAMPMYEKWGLNASIINKILVDHEEFLSNGGYICDGARSIQHETAFQDYLEKYFEFRKAYCKLHIAYRPSIKMALKILYPFRTIIKRYKGFSVIQKINALLEMETINRSWGEKN